MWLAPIKSGLGEHKMQDFDNSMHDWANFSQNTKHAFGVDMSTLTNSYREEQIKYFLQVRPGFLSCLSLAEQWLEVKAINQGSDFLSALQWDDWKLV
jgi:hypothetical protein